MVIHVIRAGAFAALLVLCIGNVAAAQSVDDNLVYLRAMTVDPGARTSLLDARTVEFSPDSEYLIKLDGPMTPARRTALAKAGVVLRDYIPRHAWRVDLATADPAAIRTLGFVTWLGEFDADWKLCPNLSHARPYESPERQAIEKAGEKRVIVDLAPIASRQRMRQSMQSLGAIVEERSMMTGANRLIVDVDTASLRALCEMPGVRFVEEAPEAAPRNQSTAWIAQSNIPDATSIWDRGLHGENQLVGVIDWDLDETHCAFYDDVPFGDMHRKIQAYYGFDENTLFGWHGTHVVDTLAGEPLDGNADANLRGMAYAARIVFQDQAATITSTNLFDRLTIAHDEGARIHSNSWGATVDNSYNAWAHDIDEFSFLNEDDLVIFAVINGGASTPILSPENAKNCLAVAAAGDAPTQDSPGSGGTGPTIDGRQKPEVWMTACSSTSADFGTDCGAVTRACATSWAAPATAGMAALARQYFTEGYYPTGDAEPADAFTPSGSLIKAMLINSAVDMSGIAGYFGPREGWGRILLEDPLFFEGDTRRLLVEDIRNADGLNTGGMHDYEFDVLSSNEPLKITMAFADAPSTVGTSFAPVNDLDLVVTAPGGSVYRGNVFELNESTTGGTADMLNTCEQVHRLTPETGRWHVSVRAREVNVGTQGFAIVMTGDVAAAAGPHADLDVTLDPSGPISADVGDLIDATITVTNHGPDTATNVRLRYQLPAGLSIVQTDSSDITCTDSTDGVDCSVAELSAEKFLTATFQIRVNQSGSFTTTAEVSSDTNDAMLDNDTADLVIETSLFADLSVSSADSSGALLQGRSTVVEVIVSNDGPDAAMNPSLIFVASSGLTIDSISTCASLPNASTCALSSLSGGEVRTIKATIRASADAGETQMLQVRIEGSLDSDTSNNELVIPIHVAADTDRDGVSDDNDVCPDGVDTQDTDADGTPDACDECPEDPDKVMPGVCGCGMSEIDSDGDGIEDCADLCPDDPNKIIPGDCGCGASDEDSNGNGVPDCMDTPVDVTPPGGEMPVDIPDDVFRLEDLDPCLVRYLLQSFLGIPMCGPCISFSLLATIAGMSLMRRSTRRRRRHRHR